MCRIAAHTGAPLPLSTLLFDPPHSLERQAYVPRELIHGTVNVDGTGVVWWNGSDTRPLRYVTSDAPWQDPNLSGLAGRLTGSTIVAAVRSASRGIPIGPANVAPFVVEELAAVHNGFVEGFRGPLGQELLAALPAEAYAQLDTMNDSKVLFLHAVAAYEGSLERAARHAVAVVGDAARAHGTMATLNLVLARAGEIVAVRHSVNGPVNSLYVATTDHGHTIASEPLDDSEEWKPVPEHHVVRITPDTVAVTPLESP